MRKAWLVFVMVGCTVQPLEGRGGDGEDDRFLSSKADLGTLDPQGNLAPRVLELVNTARLDDLLDGVKFSTLETGSLAAQNIVAYRLGDDGEVETQDDEKFETLAELDAIPFVGPAAFELLLAFVTPEVISGLPVGTILFEGRAEGIFTRDHHHYFEWETQPSEFVSLTAALLGENPGSLAVHVGFYDDYSVSSYDLEVEGDAAVLEDGSFSIEIETDVHSHFLWPAHPCNSQTEVRAYRRLQMSGRLVENPAGLQIDRFSATVNDYSLYCFSTSAVPPMQVYDVYERTEPVVIPLASAQ